MILYKTGVNLVLLVSGGGINEKNLEEILCVSGAKEFHGSARSHISSKMEYRNSCISMGGSGDEYGQMIANLERIKCLTDIARDCGLR